MQPRKTNTYEVFPPASSRPAEKNSSRHVETRRKTDDLDPSRLPEKDRELLLACWELAIQYKERGRSSEAVEYFLVAAALFERSGHIPRPIYEVVLSLDPDNALAASRLDSDEVAGARGALFVQHVLARHEPAQIIKALEDEKQRNWVTPPRGSQQTCPDCGMGVPSGEERCAFCGARLDAHYKKRGTAAYRVPQKAQTLPRGIPVKPESAEKSARIATPRDSIATDTAHGTPDLPPTRPSEEKQTREILVRLLERDGSLLTEGIIGREGGWIGSVQGALGRGLDELPDKVVYLAPFEEQIAYRVQAGMPVYQVLQGSTVFRQDMTVQAGRHLFRIGSRKGHIEIAILSQDTSPLAVCRFPSNAVTVGRMDSDLEIPQDPYLAERHIRVTTDESGALTLTDLDTDSGTFLSLPEEGRVPADTVLRIQDIFVVLTLPA